MQPLSRRDLAALLLLWALPAVLAAAQDDLSRAFVAQTRSDDTVERSRRERELHDRMRQRRTNHFSVSFEGPEEAALSWRVLEALEGAYWRIGGTLSVLPDKAIPVVLYTTEQFRDITRSPTWAAGAFDGIIRLPVRGALENPSELNRILAHEYTHAIVYGLAPRNVPTWLNEGLASALEEGDLAWARDRIRRAGRPAALRDLRVPFAQMTEEQAQLAYATSALAAQRLLDEAGSRALVNLLHDLGAGREFEVAFAHRMRRSFAEFQAELDGAR